MPAGKRMWTVLAGLVTVTACGPGPDASRGPVSPRSSAPTAQHVAQFAKLVLPADAHDFQTYAESALDEFMLLRFRMKRGDRKAFLTRSGLPKPRKGDNPVQESFAHTMGWRLDELTQFEGTSENEASPIRQVVIDTSGQDTLTVYVAAFTT